MKSIVGHFRHASLPGVGPQLERQAHRQWALGSVLGWAAAIAATYLLITGLLHEDRAGLRTLHLFAPLVTGLRFVGLGIEQAGNSLAEHVPPLLASAILLLAFAGLLFVLRRRGQNWRDAVALSLLLPAFGASALLFRTGNAWGGAGAGLIAAVALLDLSFASDPPWRGSHFLWLLPVGLGLLLRFYALAQIANGYAEHAAVQHADFSIPYSESLIASIRSLSLTPFVPQAWNVLLREHSGTFALVGALGFAIFGVSLLVSRIVSAVLGTLAIYVAYRLGEALEDYRLGLLFSFLFAIGPWNIAMSRYGTAEHVLSPLQLLLALLFLVRALKGGRLIDALLAAIITAFSWIIYAPNLVVPIIAGCLLMYQAIRNPGQVRRNWLVTLVSIICFAFVSFALLSKSFPQGILQPNVRTGYLGSGPLLGDWPKRLDMLGKEASQLLVQASDPWFSLPWGGGLTLLESVLLVPGILLSARTLRDSERGLLGALIVLGIPLAIVPAVLAPDVSFRRLSIVATLSTLASAYALLHLFGVLRSAGVTRVALAVVGVGAVVLVTASSTFSYFDRVTVGEEMQNAWFRSLVGTAAEDLGKEPVILVTPRRNQHVDVDRYMDLMARNELMAAKSNGVPRGDLYLVTSCEDPVGAGGRKETLQPPPVIVVAVDIVDFRDPCTPEFLSKLTQHYRGSTLIVARPTDLPPDLAPAPR